MSTTPIQSRVITRLDGDLFQILLNDRGRQLLGITIPKIWSSHGGSCTAHHIAFIREECGLAGAMRRYRIVEIGRGIIQMGLKMLSHSPSCRYVGVEVNEERNNVA